MRDFLLSACPVLVWVFCAFHLVLLIVMFKKYGETKNNLFLLSALVTAGLFYDALILSLGTVLQAGPALKALSQVRYISHGALIPLLLPISAYAIGFKKTGKTITWILTIALILNGKHHDSGVQHGDSAGNRRHHRLGKAEDPAALPFRILYVCILCTWTCYRKQRSDFLHFNVR